jgi:hypothetical protein
MGGLAEPISPAKVDFAGLLRVVMMAISNGRAEENERLRLTQSVTTYPTGYLGRRIQNSYWEKVAKAGRQTGVSTNFLAEVYP